MLRNFALLVCPLLMTGCAAGLRETVSDTSAPFTFYVSPEGNDTWSGTSPGPNRKGTDGPFATLSRARDALRQLKKEHGGLLPSSCRVVLREGVYFLEEPFVLSPEDSGTAEAPIQYAAYPGESPVISGGTPIGGWKQTTFNGRQVWATEVPGLSDGSVYFRQLWVNGSRRTRARFPDAGYLEIADVPDATPERPWHQGVTRFAFEATAVPDFTPVEGCQAVAMTRWVESHLPVTEIQREQSLLLFGKRSVFQLQPGDPYYLEHAPEFLTQPGEWYLDREEGRLYYYPLPGESMETTRAIIPRLREVIRIEGEPEHENYVDHIAFSGLTISHSEWWFSREFRSSWPKSDVAGFSQAAHGVSGAFFARGARNMTLDRCSVCHVGGYGIEFAGGCHDNLISRCNVYDLAAGGIRIGETQIRETKAEQTFANTVSDCHIYDGGIRFNSGIGLWVGQSYDNVLTHNHIHDFHYSGFSVGWTWGYRDSLARGNIIEWNHVHHIGVRSNGDGPVLSDMGGIYTLGVRPPTIIRYNLFHDIRGLRYGGWGIYFDEGSSGVLAENNIVYRTTHGGFHQHYGKGNLVRNNIFAYARDWQVQRSRPEEHISFTFQRNIVVWNEGVLFGSNWGDKNFVLDGNLYWYEKSEEIPFGSFDWSQRSAEEDPNSQIGDPLFYSPGEGDFRLKADSPALKLGFEPIDLTGVGPRESLGQ